MKYPPVQCEEVAVFSDEEANAIKIKYELSDMEIYG